MRRHLLPLFLAGALVSLDQWSKAWVVSHIALGERFVSLWGVLHLTHTENSGAAFGALRGVTFQVADLSLDAVVLLGLVSLLTALVLGVAILSAPRWRIGTGLAVGLLMGGAIGNGLDRWSQGYVVDFLLFESGGFSFPVFNVADIAISLGAGLLILMGLLPRSGRAKSASDR